MSDPASLKPDSWGDGQNYEAYMGRWSRRIARLFVEWLEPAAGLDWLEVGCGTGALTGTVLASTEPRSILAIDPSAPFVEYARRTLPDARVLFEVGSASELPAKDASADAVVSALAYNFFPDRRKALAEMLRVAKPGGRIAFYVWDYPGGGMGFMDAFWKAAIAVDPNAESAGERSRFPFCTPDGLREELQAAGAINVETRAIEVSARFEDYEDLWAPFTRGTGPAPAYFKRLEAKMQDALRQRLAAQVGDSVPIEFPARAWAVRARKA
ncbi:MAG: class I SAM-dependent methyltransferase [Dehalococcoidia bacterium]